MHLSLKIHFSIKTVTILGFFIHNRIGKVWLLSITSFILSMPPKHCFICFIYEHLWFKFDNDTKKKKKKILVGYQKMTV